MDKLRALQYFVASAEAGSFTAAARHLELSVPAVQKLVIALERSLVVTLFERTTRGLTLTSSGASYLESCRPLLLELSAAEAANRGKVISSPRVVTLQPAELPRPPTRRDRSPSPMTQHGKQPAHCSLIRVCAGRRRAGTS